MIMYVVTRSVVDYMVTVEASLDEFEKQKQQQPVSSLFDFHLCKTPKQHNNICINLVMQKKPADQENGTQITPQVGARHAGK